MQPDEPGTALPPAFAAVATWQATLVAGIVTLILGLIVAFHPSGSLNVIAVLIGVLMIISGLFHLIRMFRGGESHRVWLGISGLLLVTLGVVLLRDLRLTVAPADPGGAFFVSGRGTAYSPSTVQAMFRDLTIQSGLRGPHGRGPRLHDLRATSAVTRLL